MIEVKHLRKKYSRGKEVITDLNLTFGEVGLVVVAGKSGCGKTTLINMLGGMDLDYEGEILVDGLELHNSKYKEIADYRNFTSAFVFQKNSLFEFLTVEENLKLCLNIQNNDSNISEALERVGLKGFENKKVKSLSGGEKQRVAIARALIKDSKIVFADEPTSALDSKNAHKIFQLFKELSKDRLVVVVTHDVKKATMYANRLIRLIDGDVEEDTVYSENTNEVRKLNPKSSKRFAMLPIFKYNLKQGLIINLFVIILLIAALCITNIAIEGKNVKDEYDKFGTEEEFFNVDRAIQTEIANDMNMYQIVKRGEATDPYYYIQNAVTDYDYDLSEGDYAYISANYDAYQLYEGTNDIAYENIIIEGISKRTTITYTTSGKMNYRWFTYTPTNFTSYIYDKDCNYDLIAGRLPKADNEILVTDTVADMFLRSRAYDPGVDYDPYYRDYIVDYNEILADTYTLYNKKTGQDQIILNTMKVYDTYGTVEGVLNVDAKTTYYLYDVIEYKVVGVINTGLVDYYTYDYDAGRYYILDDFVQQSGNEEYMNSLKYQPSGYIVVPNGLQGTNTRHNLQETCSLTSIEANGYEIKNAVKAFYGEYDYSGYGFVGYEDNLQIDYKNRLYGCISDSNSLKDDEVIISLDLAKKLYPELGISSSNAKKKLENIAYDDLDVEFYVGSYSVIKKLHITGIAKNYTDGDLYVSDSLFCELCKDQKGPTPTLSINLKGLNVKARKKIMQEMYDLGYALMPLDNMPGAYLEFVSGKGEMICNVDYEGLSSLFPYHEEIVEGTTKYFVVDGVKYGTISGEYVLMNSSVVRKIALDDSYYTSQGNISPYYLYSDYYNSKNEFCETKSDTGNSILEIVDGLYKFFLVVSLILAIGFIYLKEFRQSGSVTRLSMLGVRNKDLIMMNILTYIPMAIIIGISALLLSKLFVNVVNNLYSFTFFNTLMNEKLNTPLFDANGNTVIVATTVHRIRLMFTSSTYITTIITTLSVMLVTLASSIFVTLRSRK